MGESRELPGITLVALIAGVALIARIVLIALIALLALLAMPNDLKSWLAIVAMMSEASYSSSTDPSNF